MRSFFSRKKASELPTGHGTKMLLRGLKEQSQGSQGREMNTLIVKKILRNNLDEFLQERMAYVKYHHAEAR